MIIKVELSTKMAHFGTPFSNHTSKLSHRVPSKSMMKGMLGASMGIDFMKSQELPYRFSFKWINKAENQMISKTQLVLDSKNDVKSVLKLKDWERGKLKRSVDYTEHLFNSSGRLKAVWIIEVEDGKEKEILDFINNPIYPMYLGKSEHLLRVDDVKMLNTDKKTGVGTFSQFFIGDVDYFVMTERMTESMKGYRKPNKFEDVYTLDRTITGIPKYGFYIIEEDNYCIW